MANPEFYLFDAREEYRGRLVPVYRSTRGLSQTMLRRHIEQALERYAEAIDEPLPGELRARHQLIGRRQAFREIHNPPSYAVARRAERRLAFDELLAVQLAVVRRKRRLAQAGLAPAIAEPDTVRGFLESLPFALTAAQRRSLTELEGEIASTTPMARLLQGDVGSGKTVVALAAMLACANSGSQAALMAPTEVLAEQHFRTISSLLDTGRDMLSFGLTDLPYMQRRHVRAVLLTGSAGARKRREALAAIRNGSAGLVVGTHALIQDEVEFQRLGLAVVDEQHRFGVEQRSALRGGPDGATAPHLLVMTATPIPRSLALTAYGDLDLSLIDELPPGRAGVATKLLVGRARDEAFARARVEIAAGRQVFVICPLVEGSERVASRAATEEREPRSSHGSRGRRGRIGADARSGRISHDDDRRRTPSSGPPSRATPPGPTRHGSSRTAQASSSWRSGTSPRHSPTTGTSSRRVSPPCADRPGVRRAVTGLVVGAHPTRTLVCAEAQNGGGQCTGRARDGGEP